MDLEDWSNEFARAQASKVLSYADARLRNAYSGVKRLSPALAEPFRESIRSNMGWLKSRFPKRFARNPSYELPIGGKRITFYEDGTFEEADDG